MVNTSNLVITLMEVNQEQKEATFNAALRKLDAILNIGAVSQGDNTPPVSPTNGDLYLLGSSPTGVWTGRSKDIAYYQQSTWRFLDPKEGATFWVNDEDKFYTWDGSNWIAVDGINNLSDVVITTPAQFQALVYNGTNWVNTANLTSLNKLGTAAATELTIASAAITVTKSYHKIDTESDAGSDDLESITGGSDGDLLILRAEDDSRTVVLKDGIANLRLNGDFSLDSVDDRIMLQKDGSNWYELFRSDNGA